MPWCQLLVQALHCAVFEPDSAHSRLLAGKQSLCCRQALEESTTEHCDGTIPRRTCAVPSMCPLSRMHECD